LILNSVKSYRYCAVNLLGRSYKEHSPTQSIEIHYLAHFITATGSARHTYCPTLIASEGFKISFGIENELTFWNLILISGASVENNISPHN
jgi:hypothetical protein